MKTILSITAAAALLAVASQSAHAHTQAFGFIPQANGDVTFYIGTYGPGHSAPSAAQGQLDITAGPTTGSFAFTNVHANTSSSALGLTGTTAPGTFYTETTPFGTNVHFQSVTVSGLSSGSYTFDISGMSSALWLQGSGYPFPVTASVTVSSVVPEPSSLALLGMGVAGLAAARRRRRKTSDESDNEA